MEKTKSKVAGRYAVAALVLLVLAALFAAGCAGPAGEQGPQGPQGLQGPQGPAGTVLAADLSCTECHNDTTLLVNKSYEVSESVHGTGDAFVRGTSASCAGCHGSEGFKARVAAGQTPEELTQGVDSPSPMNCRTCHEIHTTYTEADFALADGSTNAVTLYSSGAVYDSGDGNLCANCHQPRREIEVDDSGMVNVSSTHWGPHHGPQAAAFLGVSGWGVDGSPHIHYQLIEDGCPTCHMVNENHTMEPNVAACQACHTDATDFDIDGSETEIEDLILQLEQLLVDAGMLETASHEPYHAGVTAPSDLHPVVGMYPEAQAGALWNYIYIAIEDGSHGAHNPTYIKALLETAIAAMQ